MVNFALYIPLNCERTTHISHSAPPLNQDMILASYILKYRTSPRRQHIHSGWDLLSSPRHVSWLIPIVRLLSLCCGKGPPFLLVGECFIRSWDFDWKKLKSNVVAIPLASCFINLFLYYLPTSTHRNLLDWQHVQICNLFINNIHGLHNFHRLSSHLILSLPCPVLSAVNKQHTFLSLV